LITAGEEWAGAIDRRLEEADTILLLLSAGFVHSRYSFDVEMKRAVERHERKEALVIPVVLRPVLTAGMPFAALQALPRDARAATDWPSLDAALVDIAEGLRVAIGRRLSDWMQPLRHGSRPAARVGSGGPHSFLLADVDGDKPRGAGWYATERRREAAAIAVGGIVGAHRRSGQMTVRVEVLIGTAQGVSHAERPVCAYAALCRQSPKIGRFAI
jgi:hypothetical protein